jgi:hypothetical protein
MTWPHLRSVLGIVAAVMLGVALRQRVRIRRTR